MPSELLSTARRDGVLAILAFALLTAPLWTPALSLGNPTYQYERLEVTADDAKIQYANESAVPSRTPISDEIACSGWDEARACAFERLLLENQTVPTTVRTNNPNMFPGGAEERYRFVIVDDDVYEPTYAPNRSAQTDDGWYRVDLDIERTDANEVLRRVSLQVDSNSVPAAVADAVRDGEATTRHEVDVPETPIRLENGTYYRVYEADWSDDAPPIHHALNWFLRYVAPFVALYLFARLWTRIEYVGSDDETTEQRTEWGP